MYKTSDTTIRHNRSTNIYQPINIVLNKGKSRLPNKVPTISQIHSLSLVEPKGVDEDEVGKVTIFDLGISILVPKYLTLQMMYLLWMATQ